MTIDDVLFSILSSSYPKEFEKLSDPSEWTPDTRDAQLKLMREVSEKSVIEAQKLLKTMLTEQFEDKPVSEWIFLRLSKVVEVDFLRGLREQLDTDEGDLFDYEWLGARIRECYKELETLTDIVSRALEGSGIEEL